MVAVNHLTQSLKIMKVSDLVNVNMVQLSEHLRAFIS
jgi:hypothetical protein